MRFLQRNWALITLPLLAHASHAQPVDSDPEVSVPERSLQADIVLVGDVRESEALVRLLKELLAEQEVRCRITHGDGLDETELLDTSGSGEPKSVRIWITLPQGNLARLFFVSPDLQRYLYRDVPLRSGLDALGQERIAQVVQSSVLALIRGEAGMSRQEMRSAFRSQHAAAQSAQPPVPAPLAAPPSHPSPRRQLARPDQEPRPRPLWRRHVSAGYGAQWSGVDQGLLQGPRIRVGLSQITAAAPSWMVTAFVERRFVTSHATQDITLDIQSTATRLLLGVRLAQRHPWALFTSFGGGVDVVGVDPEPLPNATTRPRPSHTHTEPWVRTEVGIEWRQHHWCFSLAGTGDVALFDTHYDLVRGEDQETVLTPWPVRPGATLDVGAFF